MDTTTQIYLEIMLESGVAVLGESKAGGYENRIDIESFQFKARAQKQSLKELENKKVVANLVFESVTVTKFFDRASLLLAGVLNRREKFTEAKIAIDQQYIEDDQKKYRNEILILTLRNGYVADIKLRTSEGKAGASIREDISLSFHDFSVLYYAEDREANAGRLMDDYRWEPCFYEASRPLQEA